MAGSAQRCRIPRISVDRWMLCTAKVSDARRSLIRQCDSLPFDTVCDGPCRHPNLSVFSSQLLCFLRLPQSLQSSHSPSICRQSTSRLSIESRRYNRICAQPHSTLLLRPSDLSSANQVLLRHFQPWLRKRAKVRIARQARHTHTHTYPLVALHHGLESQCYAWGMKRTMVSAKIDSGLVLYGA